MTGESSNGEELLRRLNTAVAHPARIYDVWLGGKDNYPADQAAAAAGLKAFPSTISSVRANRAAAAPAPAADSHVVYVDNDPVVMLHAQALLTSTAPGVTDYIEADLRDPRTILADAARTLDFTQPVAIMLIAIVQFISADDHPYEIVNSLVDAVPPGSFLVLSHVASDIFPEELAAFARAYNERSSEKVTLRNREEVARFFTGLDLVEPGIVQVSKWRPRSELEAAATDTMWCGVARKTA
jgi:hypothetical protein